MAWQGPDTGEGPSWGGPWFHAKIELPPLPAHTMVLSTRALLTRSLYYIQQTDNPTRAGFVFRASSFVRALSPR